MIHKIENEKLIVSIKEHGAELSSVINKENEKEYMWNGNPEFWGRTSPVLFPFVGSLKNKKYTYENKEYEMGQHGFARDMDFKLVSKEKNVIWFELVSNEETLEKYPFRFKLQIGYVLKDNRLDIIWKAKNMDNKEMYFSIGAHPAFMCPINSEDKQTDYFIKFKNADIIKYEILDAEGTVSNSTKTLELKNNELPISESLFDEDALIIENNQCHEVSLLNKNKETYITVKFDTPLFGLWSPAKKNAPFICIEPWYGRADKADFEGELNNREYGNQLEPNEQFEKSYTIVFS